MKKKTDTQRKFKVVSLFSGAGGLDWGFHSTGFEIIWSNDFNKDACATYRENIGDHIRCGDINQYIDELNQFENKVDVLIGGPPCQGFSVAGKMDPNDPRSKNVFVYLDAIKRIKPKLFVMENVKALGKLEKWSGVREHLLSEMRKMGYSTNYIVVDSSEFNVPQKRERVLFIGFKGNSKIIPNLEEILKPYKKKGISVRKALSVLDHVGTGNNPDTCKARVTLAANPVLRKSPYAGMLFNGLGRPVKLDGFCATLPASMGGNKTPIIDDAELYDNAPSWVEDYHKQIQDGSIEPVFRVAPDRLRRLTVKEASVIQTFPIQYKWMGSQSSIYTQIGNAVPCNLAKQVAKMVKDYLEGL